MSFNKHEWWLYRTAWSYYLLASQEGACVIIGQKCCTYTNDGFDVQQSAITSIERAVEEWHKEENTFC